MGRCELNRICRPVNEQIFDIHEDVVTSDVEFVTAVDRSERERSTIARH